MRSPGDSIDDDGSTNKPGKDWNVPFNPVARQ